MDNEEFLEKLKYCRKEAPKSVKILLRGIKSIEN